MDDLERVERQSQSIGDLLKFKDNLKGILSHSNKPRRHGAGVTVTCDGTKSMR